MPLPIVHLPGASGRSSYLRPVADRLQHFGPTILVDYPGLGDAPFDPAIRSAADLYEHVMAALPERFDLVALSMGSLLALTAALQQPQRIRRLVLVAPAGGINPQLFGATDWREGGRANRPCAPTWLLDDRTDLSARLGEIVAPTLLVFGDCDLISPASLGRFLLAHLRDAKLEIVPGGTHDLEHEYSELVASLIAAHLTG